MSQWQGRSQGTSLGYRIFIFLIKTSGVKAAYLLLRFVALYYLLFSRSSSAAIRYFYVKRMGFSMRHTRKLLYANYYIFGQTLIDKVAIMAGGGEKFTFDFDGEEYLREMVNKGKGGLLLSGHAGNWEAAGQLLKRIGTKVNIVMYDGENPQIKKVLEKSTEDRTFNVIFIKNDLSHIYQINDALANNEIICMHADRFRPGNKTLTGNFLGAEAKFPEGPFLLSLILNTPVAYVYSFKEKNNHYHLYSTPLKYFSKAKGDTVQAILNDYISSLETMLKKYPEQWFNYYDFWAK